MLELENIEGFEFASKKTSLTAADGTPLLSPIEGLIFRPMRAVSHDKGYLTEIYRTDWGVTDLPLVQINSTTTFPGQVRAWGIHQNITDRLFALSGSLCVAVFDGRKHSKTYGCVNEFFIGEHSQGLVLIPPGLWHGWKNIGNAEATIISMPSDLYNYDDPDRWELPWDSLKAEQAIPYRWPVGANS
ncbi:dTDP-4-dehydrorhamnose 3,5-epimerase family protein [Polynucleobacter sp. JS-JIR-II-b4]|uniref:dTDP-4-dehydrorhamnose 3,5-epimerase family protein n=1 Tax=Polynucleobacter sp. JS-JIR-II-b4 TaxID=1758390 RepID=UPI001BFE60D2|nr:dTDP-4-dehydrorhamnose 3,5-epimerase family protein [Polynucleobacter sp. JS-JIR-II-b4]QWE02876.1 dTDP-4-dehydrorhamnose 3,5-epimerase family protein [Polynucleobacter sp. JS-JIR-II-b4]